MRKEIILNYFLEKPGTFDEDANNEIILNLASREVLIISNNDIKFRKTKETLHNGKSYLNTLQDNNDWETVSLKDINENELFELIDQSYNGVMQTLPEEEKDEILDLEW